jgi:hypothetical protein
MLREKGERREQKSRRDSRLGCLARAKLGYLFDACLLLNPSRARARQTAEGGCPHKNLLLHQRRRFPWRVEER